MKRLLLIGFSIVLFISVFLIGCTHNKSMLLKYPIGKDTIKAFGDARFQILKTNNDDKVLNDVEQNFVIESDVYNYIERDDSVYFYGKIGFTMIDLKNIIIKQYKDYNGFSKEELTNTKLLENKNVHYIKPNQLSDEKLEIYGKLKS